MDLEKILAELRAERARIEEAILAIERIAPGVSKRRGRRPKWLTPAESISSGRDGDNSSDNPKRSG